MIVEKTAIPDILLIKPKVYGDSRGFFQETFQVQRYLEAGIKGPFVQDNLSFSERGVLRGLHYQWPNPQGKLVSVLKGEVFDVAVDIRQGSPTFGQWIGEYLSEKNHHQLWIPEGFAHGFCVTSDTALFSYKCTTYYDPKAEQNIRWDDLEIGVEWPIKNVIISKKDSEAMGIKILHK